MSDQRFAVIGLGQFGSAIAKNLSLRGAEVLAIDHSLEKVESMKDEVGGNVAEMLINPDVVMCIQLPDDYEIVEVKAPTQVFGRSLNDIGLREKYDLNLVTILRKNNQTDKDYHIIGVPTPETIVEKSDIIALFGLTKNIERFLDINK
jgi:trk system potassium uptake protein TrkA